MATKMTHSGSLGMQHSITVSDDYLEHANKITAKIKDSINKRLSSDQKDAMLLANQIMSELKTSCYNYVKIIVDADKDARMSLKSFDDMVASVEKWRMEQNKKIQQLLNTKDINSLKKMLREVTSQVIFPGKDLRIAFNKGQPSVNSYKYNKKSPDIYSSFGDWSKKLSEYSDYIKSH